MPYIGQLITDNPEPFNHYSNYRLVRSGISQTGHIHIQIMINSSYHQLCSNTISGGISVVETSVPYDKICGNCTLGRYTRVNLSDTVFDLKLFIEFLMFVIADKIDPKQYVSDKKMVFRYLGETKHWFIQNQPVSNQIVELAKQEKKRNRQLRAQYRIHRSFHRTL